VSKRVLPCLQSPKLKNSVSAQEPIRAQDGKAAIVEVQILYEPGGEIKRRFCRKLVRARPGRKKCRYDEIYFLPSLDHDVRDLHYDLRMYLG